ncbi:hypothetical protein EDD27_2359 [Nonomuraea polychroma]|uniref:Uncharacterized protein n=1 Tax=Nonomuraea polychroma TaxID=46176 RepID=A0A438M2B2_9ACTN|nr:hypothetical protein EDD27_2359 [Nonomuraea polychroma]
MRLVQQRNDTLGYLARVLREFLAESQRFDERRNGFAMSFCLA